MPALVWTEPIEREDFKLAPGDIPEAITWFKEKTNQDPRLIMLCPKNEKFASEIPEGINVIYRGGVLMGEVWLSKTETWGATPMPAPEPVAEIKIPPGPPLPLPPDPLPCHADKPLKRQRVVSKIPTKGILPTRIMKQRVLKQNNGRGRPRKQDDISRTTRWRRGKELQLELPIEK